MFDLPPTDLGVELFAASRGMSKGLAQTDGPQFIPKAFVQVGSVQVGAQWKNVTSNAAEGEGAAFVNWQRKLGATQLSVGVTFKFQTAIREPTDGNALELNGALSRKLGKIGARISAVYSPDDLGSTKRSLYMEGGPSYDLTKSLRISANLGHRTRANGPDYTSFNAGISTVVGRLTFDARFYDTSQSELGEIYNERVVVSARLVL